MPKVIAFPASGRPSERADRCGAAGAWIAILLAGLLSIVVLGLAGCAATGARPPADDDPYASLPPDERVARYQEILGENPEDASLHFRLGNAYYDLHQLARAEDEYRRALELDPELAPAHANLGSVLEESEDYEGALEEYLKAVELAPDDARAHTNLGSLYYAMGQDETARDREKLYDRAVDEYREALDLDPDNVEAHYNLGVAYADARIYREALRQWQRVMELDPGGPVGNKALSNINLLRSLRLRETARDSAE